MQNANNFDHVALFVKSAAECTWPHSILFGNANQSQCSSSSVNFPKNHPDVGSAPLALIELTEHFLVNFHHFIAFLWKSLYFAMRHRSYGNAINQYSKYKTFRNVITCIQLLRQINCHTSLNLQSTCFFYKSFLQWAYFCQSQPNFSKPSFRFPLKQHWPYM